jgi:5-methyltetrahydrofolate--homocysteine methyltransferase
VTLGEVVEPPVGASAAGGTQERLREQHASKQRLPVLALDQARANREQVSFDDLSTPEFTGLRTMRPDLTALREMIDWQFLFLAWELKGKYPAILDQPVARELFDDANALLDEIIADQSFQAHGAYGFWRAP